MSIKQYVVFVFILWNVFVFITYGVDKIRAIKGKWRIPEKTLLWESILFGGLGAFLGGSFFHHKTLKWYFRLVGILELSSMLFLPIGVL